MPVAYIYARVSGKEQADSGLGREAQIAACERERSRLDIPLGAAPFTDDAVSGATPIAKCPALKAVLAVLRRGDVLLVAKRDRLGRNVEKVCGVVRSVRSARARIVSAAGEGTGGDSAGDVLMAQIIDAFAQHERALISERTRSALAAKRARGEAFGFAPFGWRAVDGRLVEDADEQGALRGLRAWRAKGASLNEIARQANAMGVKPRRGKAWYASSVRSVLGLARAKAGVA